jgi:hypothetical protein
LTPSGGHWRYHYFIAGDGVVWRFGTLRQICERLNSVQRTKQQEYLAEPPPSPDGSQSPPSRRLHDGNRKRWPTLSKMAIDVLSIPAMSAKPERGFSGARRAISWDRMQLGEANIKRVEWLKIWLRSGLTVWLLKKKRKRMLHKSEIVQEYSIIW